MSDLTEFVDAAVRAWWGDGGGIPWDETSAAAKHHAREWLSPIVAAVAPLIRAAARRELADELAERLRSAAWKLDQLTAEAESDDTATRLADKASGVRRALSYVEEALR